MPPAIVPQPQAGSIPALVDAAEMIVRSTSELPAQPCQPSLSSQVPPRALCATEAHHNSADSRSIKLVLDNSSNSITRWRMGSVITYNVQCDSFLNHSNRPSPRRCDLAVRALDEAARQWNELDVVTFQKVADDEPAVFQLVYKPCNPHSHYARSFFPDEYHPSSKLKLRVYDLAFQHSAFMSNIFCHELGHMLGLRHEFAANEPGSHVSFGPDDALSVMNYHHANGEFHRYRIGALDQEWTRRLYASTGYLSMDSGEYRIVEIDPCYGSTNPGVTSVWTNLDAITGCRRGARLATLLERASI